MKPESPLQLIASGALRALSFPVRRVLEYRIQSRMNRAQVISVELTPQNIHKWRVGTPSWEALRSIKMSSSISTIWLTVKIPPVGWASIWSFRELLLELKNAGKSLLVLIESSDARTLAMTACADKIWIQEGVELFWNGIGGRHNFYAAVLERYGIEADVEAAGAFKSFGEQFTRTSPSEANRLQMLELYDSLYQVVVDNLSLDTGLEKERLETLLYSSPVSVDSLQECGLIAGTGNVFSIREQVQEYTNSKGKPLSFVHYVNARKWVDRWTWGKLGTTIVVLHLDGNIVDFEQDQQGIVADRVVKQLEKIMEMPWVEGVVLKINSPGGSAIASDRIATAIEKLKQTKKVIAYMENVAASGGYYISAVTDWIWASPQTITGSIGVVGGKLVLGRALKEQGVQAHVISVGGDSGFMDYWSPFSEEQRVRFRGFLSRTYERFKWVVSKGRRMSLDGVEAVAQGRVWTGVQAFDAGLIDEVGGFDACLVDLATRLGYSERSMSVQHLRTAPRGWRKWRKKIFGMETSNIESSLLERAPLLVRTLQDHPNQALVLLPFEVEGQ